MKQPGRRRTKINNPQRLPDTLQVSTRDALLGHGRTNK